MTKLGAYVEDKGKPPVAPAAPASAAFAPAKKGLDAYDPNAADAAKAAAAGARGKCTLDSGSLVDFAVSLVRGATQEKCRNGTPR